MEKKREPFNYFRLFRTVKRFFVIYLPLLIFLAAVLSIFYQNDIRSERDIVEAETSHTIALQKAMIIKEFDSVVSDLMYLSDHHELKELLSGIDSKEILSEEFLLFAKRKAIYDQVRFLGDDGMEVVRVDFKGGNSGIVQGKDLQSKKQRYYFSESFSLEKNEVYVSRFDLNVERGEVEQPIKPMIRFATPVFDDAGAKRGVIVLNYLGQYLLDDFANMEKGFFSSPILLDGEGFSLKGLSSDVEWGFMYVDGKNKVFGKDFPGDWNKIAQKESGQFYSKAGLFTFTSLYPLKEILRSRANFKKSFSNEDFSARAKEYVWKIISFVPMKRIRATPAKVFVEFLILYFILSLPLGLGAWLLALAQVRHKEADEKVKKSIEMKLNFISVVSHELRTPLVSMKEGVSILLDGIAGEISEKQREMLDVVFNSIERLKRLTDDVLNYQRLEAGRTQFDIKLNDLNEVVEEVKLTMRSVTDKKGLGFSVHLAPDLPKILFDRDAIIQVLTNVVNNSIKFTEEGGLTITTHREGNVVKVIIEDTGPGVRPEELASLFQEFQQLKNAKGKGGSGLGLAISKGIMKAHRGKIWAESEEGKGTSVCFILPIVERRR